MARLGEIEYRGDGSDPRQLLNYMLQLEDQIRYALAHLGSENIQAGAIDEKLLAPAVKQKVQNIEIRMEGQERKSRELKSEDGNLRTLIVETEEGIMRDIEDVERGLRTTITETAEGLAADIRNAQGDITNLKATAQGLSAAISNAQGDITSLQATARGLSADISNAQGDITSLQATAQGLSTAISNAQGDITSLQATARGLSADISDAQGDITSLQATAQGLSTAISNAQGDITSLQATARGLSADISDAKGDITSLQATAQSLTAAVADKYGIVSGVAIVPAGVEISGGKYVKIKSGGSFEVESGNFGIDGQGNVNFASGTAGNFHITENYIGSVNDGVYMRKNVYSGGMLLPGGIWVYPNTGNDTVFMAARNGQVIVNGKELSAGWIRDASVSGNTLTLTKWDGTTVTFTK